MRSPTPSEAPTAVCTASAAEGERERESESWQQSPHFARQPLICNDGGLGLHQLQALRHIDCPGRQPRQRLAEEGQPSSARDRLARHPVGANVASLRGVLCAVCCVSTHETVAAVALRGSSVLRDQFRLRETSGPAKGEPWTNRSACIPLPCVLDGPVFTMQQAISRRILRTSVPRAPRAASCKSQADDPRRANVFPNHESARPMSHWHCWWRESPSRCQGRGRALRCKIGPCKITAQASAPNMPCPGSKEPI